MSSSSSNLFQGFEDQGFGGGAGGFGQQFVRPNPVPQAPSRFAAPPAAPFAIVSEQKQAWYATRWIWILLAFLIVFGGIAYWARTRYYSQTGSSRLCPYSAAINTVTNAEQQADLREWASLYMQARRPGVKRILSEVLNSELGGNMENKSPAAPQSVSAVDPAFTVA